MVEVVVLFWVMVVVHTGTVHNHHHPKQVAASYISEF